MLYVQLIARQYYSFYANLKYENSIICISEMCRLFSTFYNNKLNGYSLYIIKSFTNVEEVYERVLF